MAHKVRVAVLVTVLIPAVASAELDLRPDVLAQPDPPVEVGVGFQRHGLISRVDVAVPLLPFALDRLSPGARCALALTGSSSTSRRRPPNAWPSVDSIPSATLFSISCVFPATHRASLSNVSAVPAPRICAASITAEALESADSSEASAPATERILMSPRSRQVGSSTSTSLVIISIFFGLAFSDAVTQSATISALFQYPRFLMNASAILAMESIVMSRSIS
jgi:hypothetical protein